MNNRPRRQFLGQSVALTAGIGIGYWVGASQKQYAQGSALQSLTAACIGVGGKGGSDTRHCFLIGL